MQKYALKLPEKIEENRVKRDEKLLYTQKGEFLIKNIGKRTCYRVIL